MWRVGVACVALGLSSCLAGCVPGGTGQPMATTFDPKAAEFAGKTGTGIVEGQAFLRRDYGRLVTAAGERVFLIPATAYAVERFGKMFDGEYRSYYGHPVEPPPEDYYRYRRETKVDMSGRFTFEKVPPGRYIVATRVFWTEPKSFFTHGGAMYDVVEVKNDATTNAIISGK